MSKTKIFSAASAKTSRIWLFLALILCLFSGTLQARSGLSKRWVYVSSNLYVDENVQKLEQLLRRAQKAGYNGVLFTDYKTFTWWQLDDAQRWQRNAQTLRDITRELEMELRKPVARSESTRRAWAQRPMSRAIRGATSLLLSYSRLTKTIEPTRPGNPTSLERIPLFATLPSWPGDPREFLAEVGLRLASAPSAGHRVDPLFAPNALSLGCR